MFQKLKSKIKFWPYLLTLIAIVSPWFFNSGYLFFKDTAWGSQNTLDWTNSWSIVQNLVKFLNPVIPVDLLEKIFISAVILIVLFGARKVLKFFIDKEWQIFIVSLFFLFNPFIYDRLMYGQMAITASFGLILYGFGFLLEFINEKKFKQLFWAGITMGLSVAFFNHAIFFSFILFCLFLVYLFFSIGERRKNIFIKSVLIVGGLVLILNANLIIGYFVGNSNIKALVSEGIQKQDLEAFQTAGKTPGETIGNVVMMSGFWGKDQYNYADLTKIKENWGRSFYLLLPLIFWGLFAGLKNKKYRILSIGLLIIWSLSVFLALGVKVPIAREVSLWLFDHLPFYKGFREPQKWVTLVVLVYGIFLAIGIKNLFLRNVVKNNKALVSFILVFLIIMQAHLLLFGFWGQVTPVDYPEDWYETNEYIIAQDDCQSKTLFLPWHLYMSFDWIGKIVANPAKEFFTCPIIQGTNMEWGGIYDNSLEPESKLIEEWIFSKGKTDLLISNELNIRYIILAKEIDWQNYLWLEQIPKLKLIKETATLRLYERQQ